MSIKSLKGLIMISFLLVIWGSPVIAQKRTKPAKSKIEAIQPPSFKPDEMQKNILDEINTGRTNPAAYIKFLEDLKKGVKEKVINLPGNKGLLTSGGADSIDNAIRDFQKIQKLEPYRITGGLSNVANLQLTNLKEDIKLGHYGNDGSDLEVRMYKFGSPGSMMAENISYVSENAKGIVFNMILDESSKTKAHRKNLLSSEFKEIGIAFGKNKEGVSICVLVFADKFTENTVKGGANRVM